MNQIPECDWKRMRSMMAQKVDEACARILAKAERILQNRSGRNHKAYLELWKMLHKADSEITAMFDDLKRSQALFQLAEWNRHGLLSPSEVALFSQPTQDNLKLFER